MSWRKVNVNQSGSERAEGSIDRAPGVNTWSERRPWRCSPPEGLFPHPPSSPRVRLRAGRNWLAKRTPRLALLRRGCAAGAAVGVPRYILKLGEACTLC
jgi:hypothetical protein